MNDLALKLKDFKKELIESRDKAREKSVFASKGRGILPYMEYARVKSLTLTDVLDEMEKRGL